MHLCSDCYLHHGSKKQGRLLLIFLLLYCSNGIQLGYVAAAYCHVDAHAVTVVAKCLYRVHILQLGCCQVSSYTAVRPRSIKPAVLRAGLTSRIRCIRKSADIQMM